MEEQTNGPGRMTELDGLRGCAVLAVFFSHAFQIRMLWMGVDLFFVLSGFLITGILIDLKHRDLRGYFAHFYERRARRILPPYLLLLAVVSLVFGVSWVRAWFLYFGLMNYVVLFPPARFLPLVPLWSLGVEEQFYLIWPFLVYFVSEKRLPYVLGAMLALAPVLRVAAIPYDWTHQLVYKGTPFRMDCLAMGALLTFAWRMKRETIRRYGWLGLIPMGLTPFVMLALNRLGGFSTMDGTWKSNIFTYEIALVAVTGAMVWALGGRYAGILNVRALRYLGRISYTFYLIHLSALLLIGRYVANQMEVAALGMAASIAYATLSWIWIERPLLRRGRPATGAGQLGSSTTV